MRANLARSSLSVVRHSEFREACEPGVERRSIR